MESVDITDLDDDELLRRTERLAADARRADARLVEHLAELDRRDLTLKRGYGSLYEYALNRLRMSEGAAYRRIRAARAVRRSPALLEMLRDGRLTLHALVLLHPHLDEPDAAALILQAVGMRTRRLEALLAERRPEPPKRDVVRPMGPPPAPGPEAGAAQGEFELDASGRAAAPPRGSAASAARSSVEDPRPIRVSFTADRGFLRMLQRARALLRHKYPDGRLEGVMRDALGALLERRDPLVRWDKSARSRRAHPRFPQAD